MTVVVWIYEVAFLMWWCYGCSEGEKLLPKPVNVHNVLVYRSVLHINSLPKTEDGSATKDEEDRPSRASHNYCFSDESLIVRIDGLLEWRKPEKLLPMEACDVAGWPVEIHDEGQGTQMCPQPLLTKAPTGRKVWWIAVKDRQSPGRNVYSGLQWTVFIYTAWRTLIFAQCWSSFRAHASKLVPRSLLV